MCSNINFFFLENVYYICNVDAIYIYIYIALKMTNHKNNCNFLNLRTTSPFFRTPQNI